MIRDKARMFATTVGSSECLAKVNSPVWLEKFKQKNELLGAKLPPSEMNDSDMGDPPSGSQTPSGISPVSPTGQAPTSPNQDPLKTEVLDGQADFQATYRRSHSQSTNSLASCYTDTTMPSTFSPDLRSPSSPFFSPASSCGPSPNIPSPMPRLPALASADSRPRRQTFPNISAIPSYITPPASASTEQSPTNKFLQQSMASTALESPLEEMEDPSLRINSTVQQNHSSQQQQLLQSASGTPISNISPSSMAPPPNPSPVTAPMKSPHLGSPQSPPSQDEARRALEVLMNFFQYQPSAVDPQDYIIMGKLMEKLKLRGDELPGGMRSMERGDGTMPMGRKRSIHSL